MGEEHVSKYELWVAYISGVTREPYTMLRESREGAMRACERQLQYHDIDPTDWTVLANTGGDGRAMRPEDGVIVDVKKRRVRRERMDSGERKKYSDDRVLTHDE